MLKLYNTATRKLEDFKPIGDVVKIYTCGPTVYGLQHIGNYAAYIYWDLLIRALKFSGFNVKRILNFTDVGHLTSDEDSGEDKMEKGAAREGRTVWEIAQFYGDDFMRNFRALQLTEPDVIAHATDYVEADMRMVDEMTKNGFTYETDDGVYYDTAKFADYAKFARLDLSGLHAGARVSFSSEKKNASDFAVWKFIQPGEKHTMRWEYLGRPGYPGWHLECSTIIHEEFGEPIDIHTGGIDHIPVHHTNEIAQSFAVSGRELAKYWLHCNFITIDGEKISKSLGNIYTLDDLKKRGFSPLDYKMWILSGHYQGARNFTFASLEGAKTRRLNWRNRVAEASQNGATSDENLIERIKGSIENNLNSAEAFAIIDNSVISIHDWRTIEELFGLGLGVEETKLPNEVYELIHKREDARKAKDFARADEIRNELAKMNITIKDSSLGPIWQYIE